MRALRTASLLALLALVALGSRATADQVVVAGLSPAKSFRAFSGPDYENLRSRLLDPERFGPGGIADASVVLAPDLSAVDPSALSSIDLLVLSEVSNSFTTADANHVGQFVRSGGWLVLITDTLQLTQPQAGNGAAPAHIVLQGLDGGGSAASGNLVGLQSSQAGRIENVASGILDGPFGLLTSDDRLGATFHNPLIPGAHSRVLAKRNGSPLMLEIPARSLGPDSGGVLVAGDILFSDFFVPPAEIGLLENENNAIVFENFVYQAARPVPEPAAILLAALAAPLAFLATKRTIAESGRMAPRPR